MSFWIWLRRWAPGAFLLTHLDRPLRRRLTRWRYSGDRFHCPVCDSHVSHFLPFGLPPRPHAMCPVCESVEQHRLYWLYYQRHTDLFADVQDDLPRRRFSTL